MNAQHAILGKNDPRRRRKKKLSKTEQMKKYAASIRKPKVRRNRSGVEGVYHYEEVGDLDNYQNISTPTPIHKTLGRQQNRNPHTGALTKKPLSSYNPPVKQSFKQRSGTKGFPLAGTIYDSLQEDPAQVMKSLDELEFKH